MFLRLATHRRPAIGSLAAPVADGRVFYCVDIDFSAPLVGGVAYGAADARPPQ